jgi:O-antigen ligase
MTGFRFYWNLAALSVLFGGASIIHLGSAYDPLDPAFLTLRWGLIAIALIALSPNLLSAIARFPVTRKAALVILLWMAFGTVCVLSAVITEDHFDGIASTLWLLFPVPVIFFVGLPQALNGSSSRLLILGLLISNIFYIVLSFCLYPTLQFEYKGIFGHPNSLGVTAAVVAVCCLAWMLERMQTLSFRGLPVVALLVLFAASSFLVMVSGSRTSLIAVLMTLAVAAMIYARSRHKAKTVFPLAATLVLISLGLALLPDTGIAQQIWVKNSQQVLRGDILSKRDEIWMKVLDDMRLFGNGNDYFPDSVGISSHNSLMHIIGQRGPIAALLMAGFALAGMVRAFRQAFMRDARHSFSAAPALIGVCFWSLSMGEGMFGSIGSGMTLAYLFSVGVAISGGWSLPVQFPRQTKATQGCIRDVNA